MLSISVPIFCPKVIIHKALRRSCASKTLFRTNNSIKQTIPHPHNQRILCMSEKSLLEKMLVF
jgi:hypothetical protein